MTEPIVTSQISQELFKAFVLSVTGFGLAMLLTPIYTFIAYRYKFWKRQRTTTTTGEAITVFTKLHAKKFERNIPTMAGTIILAAILIVTLLFNLDKRQTGLPLLALIGGGIVGLLDDAINIRGLGGGVKGLRSWIKFLMITGVAAVGAWYFFVKLGYSSVYVPFWGPLEIGWLIIPLFIAAVVSTGNAVNISDGLDGLAGGLLATAYGVFGVVALLQGNYGIAGFCFTVVGTLLSYIWFNIYPARFFMGDVGSFALGTALGVVAMLTDTIFLLPIIGLVFVVEAGSSLLQIASKRLLGRRVFISAPVHQHLEASGWPETKVTMRFWVIGQVVGIIGLMLAVAGGLVG
ncbi:MAG: phospho-N-acetylmuramoyl-pentapeptide-transferase [Candidatus Chaera renei]|uniref:Phospho-N-acetylmuramoyl-pentapeptide-transferase n=1 Tax=Candidatus Chaera renei TaxID=2506947 RepID=A0A4Q0AJ66_9BACT|nr:MAG: phospho-N-acetylmuramoyl-pentapeptide-transferase [Candidatus Chaera renei]